MTTSIRNSLEKSTAATFAVHTTGSFPLSAGDANANAAASAVFQAASRHLEWSCSDYFLTTGKILLFPVTGIYYLISLLCNFITYSCVLGISHKVDLEKRAQLKELGGREMEFRAEDGVKLEGMYFQNPSASFQAKTILLCLGSPFSYENFAVPMVDAFLKMGHHVMAFNYRGFGKSEGSPSEEGINLDAEAALQYLKTCHAKSESEIAVLGYSLGSGPATDLASHHNLKLILDRYFSSMSDVAYDNGWYLAKAIFYLGGADFNVKEKIRLVQDRVFLARGDQDKTMLPYHQGYLEKALNHPNPRATFIEVRSSHLHPSNRDLWFHPENQESALARGKLQAFLTNG